MFKLKEADFPKNWRKKVSFVNGDETYLEQELDLNSSEFKYIDDRFHSTSADQKVYKQWNSRYIDAQQ